MPACLVMCMRCAGFVGMQTELAPGPVVHGTIVGAMRDVPCSAGVDTVEHAGENPCTCASERMSISPVHVYG